MKKAISHVVAVAVLASCQFASAQQPQERQVTMAEVQATIRALEEQRNEALTQSANHRARVLLLEGELQRRDEEAKKKAVEVSPKK